MKKYILGAVFIILILFIIDITVLKDKGIIKQAEKVQKYEKIENVDKLSVGLEEGNLAPEINLKDMEGNAVRLSDYKGKTVLLNFWASWCGPCEEEMPHMEKLSKEYKDEGFEVLAVNMTRSERRSGDVDEFVKMHNLTFTIPLDEEGVVSKDYEVMAYPTSYFIDSDGVIRSKVLGALNEEYLEKEIRRLP